MKHRTEESKPLIGAQDLEGEDEDHQLNFSIDFDGVEREYGVVNTNNEPKVLVPEERLNAAPDGDVTRPTPLSRGPVEQWEADEREERRQVGGAAVAGGIAGLVLAGPIMGLLVAGGVAAVATTKGKAGEVTRATGEAMAQAGDRLKRFDEKHHLTDKAAQGLTKSADWISDKLKPKRERERDAMYGLTA